MIDFGKHIKDLLLEHDCVILPGLGGFVANYRPAEFDRVRATAVPPSRQILFNPSLIHNDGLLFAQVSRTTGYGYKDVQELATGFIEGIRKDLSRGMKFNIEGLGYFYSDPEVGLRFSQEPGNNFLLESYGLPFLSYREFDAQSRVETYRNRTTDAHPLARQRRVRGWIYGTAAACLLGALIIIPIRSGVLNRAGIELPVVDSFRKDRSVLAETESTAGKDLSGSARSFFHSEIPNEPGKRPTIPEPEYNIVVGSFRDFGNARQLRIRLIDEGYQARILDAGNGYFRVSAGTYARQEDASHNLETLRREFESAWLLRN